MTLASLFQLPITLPVVPQVVHQLIISISYDDVSEQEIVSNLASDPVITAKTLRLANSAYFKASRTVSTLDEALKMLGFVMVRNLVLSCGLSNAFENVKGIDQSAFWRYSLSTAGIARWLARERGDNEEQAFTAGLIHALGQLVLHILLPDVAAEISRHVGPLALERLQHEKVRLGFHHGEVSSELAIRWKLPEAIGEPARYIRTPSQAPEEARPVAELLQLASWRAKVDALGLSAAAAEASCPLRKGPLAPWFEWDNSRKALISRDGGGEMPSPRDLTNGLEDILT